MLLEHNEAITHRQRIQSGPQVDDISHDGTGMVFLLYFVSEAKMNSCPMGRTAQNPKRYGKSHLRWTNFQDKKSSPSVNGQEVHGPSAFHQLAQDRT